MKYILLAWTLLLSFGLNAQDNSEEKKSNIQNYTPSKLLEKGKWDVKWFNNLYTQTKEESNGEIIKGIPRTNFFNTSVEIFTGVTNSKKFNIGVIAEFRSNTRNENALSVFGFQNTDNEARAGIGHIAPSVKIAPFSSLSNFSIQSSFFIPLHGKEVNNGMFLTQNSYIWQNRFFYDYTFPSEKFQLFTELSTRLFLGEKSFNDDGSFNPDGGFANNSLELAPGVFFSYFPTRKFTTLVYVQHAHLLDLGNDFSQNFSAVGVGVKYQLNEVFNLEVLHSNFVRGTASGLGQTYNLGLRAIF